MATTVLPSSDTSPAKQDMFLSPPPSLAPPSLDSEVSMVPTPSRINSVSADDDKTAMEMAGKTAKASIVEASIAKASIVEASIAKASIVEARRKAKMEDAEAIRQGRAALDVFMGEWTATLEATVKDARFAAYLACRDTPEDEEESKTSLPKECRIQFAYWNDKPSRKHRDATTGMKGSALLAADLVDKRRGRVMAYRFRGIDEDGCAVFDYGAVVYTPPLERVKKYSKAHGFTRRALPRIPKTRLASHKMTAVCRCMGEPVTIRVPFHDGFTWSFSCLDKVRKAIRAAMTKPGGCGCGSSGIF